MGDTLDIQRQPHTHITSSITHTDTIKLGASGQVSVDNRFHTSISKQGKLSVTGYGAQALDKQDLRNQLEMGSGALSLAHHKNFKYTLTSKDKSGNPITILSQMQHAEKYSAVTDYATAHMLGNIAGEVAYELQQRYGKTPTVGEMSKLSQSNLKGDMIKIQFLHDYFASIRKGKLKKIYANPNFGKVYPTGTGYLQFTTDTNLQDNVQDLINNHNLGISLLSEKAELQKLEHFRGGGNTQITVDGHTYTETRKDYDFATSFSKTLNTFMALDPNKMSITELQQAKQNLQKYETALQIVNGKPPGDRTIRDRIIKDNLDLNLLSLQKRFIDFSELLVIKERAKEITEIEVFKGQNKSSLDKWIEDLRKLPSIPVGQQTAYLYKMIDRAEAQKTAIRKLNSKFPHIMSENKPPYSQDHLVIANAMTNWSRLYRWLNNDAGVWNRLTNQHQYGDLNRIPTLTDYTPTKATISRTNANNAKDHKSIHAKPKVTFTSLKDSINSDLAKDSDLKAYWSKDYAPVQWNSENRNLINQINKDSKAVLTENYKAMGLDSLKAYTKRVLTQLGKNNKLGGFRGKEFGIDTNQRKQLQARLTEIEGLYDIKEAKKEKRDAVVDTMRKDIRGYDRSAKIKSDPLLHKFDSDPLLLRLVKNGEWSSSSAKPISTASNNVKNVNTISSVIMSYSDMDTSQLNAMKANQSAYLTYIKNIYILIGQMNAVNPGQVTNDTLSKLKGDSPFTSSLNRIGETYNPYVNILNTSIADYHKRYPTVQPSITHTNAGTGEKPTIPRRNIIPITAEMLQKKYKTPKGYFETVKTTDFMKMTPAQKKSSMRAYTEAKVKKAIAGKGKGDTDEISDATKLAKQAKTDDEALKKTTMVSDTIQTDKTTVKDVYKKSYSVNFFATDPEKYKAQLLRQIAEAKAVKPSKDETAKQKLSRTNHIKELEQERDMMEYRARQNVIGVRISQAYDDFNNKKISLKDFVAILKTARQNREKLLQQSFGVSTKKSPSPFPSILKYGEAQIMDFSRKYYDQDKVRDQTLKDMISVGLNKYGTDTVPDPDRDKNKRELNMSGSKNNPVFDKYIQKYFHTGFFDLLSPVYQQQLFRDFQDDLNPNVRYYYNASALFKASKKKTGASKGSIKKLPRHKSTKLNNKKQKDVKFINHDGNDTEDQEQLIDLRFIYPFILDFRGRRVYFKPYYGVDDRKIAYSEEQLDEFNLMYNFHGLEEPILLTGERPDTSLEYFTGNEFLSGLLGSAVSIAGGRSKVAREVVGAMRSITDRFDGVREADKRAVEALKKEEQQTAQEIQALTKQIAKKSQTIRADNKDIDSILQSLPEQDVENILTHNLFSELRTVGATDIFDEDRLVIDNLIRKQEQIQKDLGTVLTEEERGSMNLQVNIISNEISKKSKDIDVKTATNYFMDLIKRYPEIDDEQLIIAFDKSENVNLDGFNLRQYSMSKSRNPETYINGVYGYAINRARFLTKTPQRPEVEFVVPNIDSSKLEIRLPDGTAVKDIGDTKDIGSLIDDFKKLSELPQGKIYDDARVIFAGELQQQQKILETMKALPGQEGKSGRGTLGSLRRAIFDNPQFQEPTVAQSQKKAKKAYLEWSRRTRKQFPKNDKRHFWTNHRKSDLGKFLQHLEKAKPPSEVRSAVQGLRGIMETGKRPRPKQFVREQVNIDKPIPPGVRVNIAGEEIEDIDLTGIVKPLDEVVYDPVQDRYLTRPQPAIPSRPPKLPKRAKDDPSGAKPPTDPKDRFGNMVRDAKGRVGDLIEEYEERIRRMNRRQRILPQQNTGQFGMEQLRQQQLLQLQTKENKLKTQLSNTVDRSIRDNLLEEYTKTVNDISVLNQKAVVVQPDILQPTIPITENSSPARLPINTDIEPEQPTGNIVNREDTDINDRLISNEINDVQANDMRKVKALKEQRLKTQRSKLDDVIQQSELKKKLRAIRAKKEKKTISGRVKTETDIDVIEQGLKSALYFTELAYGHETGSKLYRYMSPLLEAGYDYAFPTTVDTTQEHSNKQNPLYNHMAEKFSSKDDWYFKRARKDFKEREGKTWERIVEENKGRVPSSMPTEDPEDKLKKPEELKDLRDISFEELDNQDKEAQDNPLNDFSLLTINDLRDQFKDSETYTEQDETQVSQFVYESLRTTILKTMTSLKKKERRPTVLKALQFLGDPANRENAEEIINKFNQLTGFNLVEISFTKSRIGRGTNRLSPANVLPHFSFISSIMKDLNNVEKNKGSLGKRPRPGVYPHNKNTDVEITHIGRGFAINLIAKGQEYIKNLSREDFDLFKSAFKKQPPKPRTTFTTMEKIADIDRAREPIEFVEIEQIEDVQPPEGSEPPSAPPTYDQIVDAVKRRIGMKPILPKYNLQPDDPGQPDTEKMIPKPIKDTFYEKKNQQVIRSRYEDIHMEIPKAPPQGRQTIKKTQKKPFHVFKTNRTGQSRSYRSYMNEFGSYNERVNAQRKHIAMMQKDPEFDKKAPVNKYGYTRIG